MEHNPPSNDENFFIATPSPVDRNIRVYRVDKAVKFLSLPEIKEITSDQTKAKFLKSKGLSEDEVKEAFHRCYAIDGGSNITAPGIMLNAVAGSTESDGRTALMPRDPRQFSSWSSFFSLCRKLLVFVGITSSCYYVYQQWLRSRAEIDRRKKDERNIKDELNHIKNELAKIAVELRKHQTLERNQANLLTEINSLKAILVSKQYFEEKQTAKLTLPSWQLNSNSTSKTESTAKLNTPPSESATDAEGPKNAYLPTSQTNGVLEKSDTKSDQSSAQSSPPPVSPSMTNGVRAVVSVLTEEDDMTPVPQCNGSSDTFDSEKRCNVETKSITESAPLSSDKKKETKKVNGKKQNSGDSVDKHKKSVTKN